MTSTTAATAAAAASATTSLAYASSTMVNVAEEAEQRLVRLIADASSAPGNGAETFVTSCEECIEQGDAEQLLSNILNYKEGSGLTLVAAMISVDRTTEEAAISACSLTCALLDRVPDRAQASRLLQQLCDGILSHALPQDIPLDLAMVIRKRQASMLATLYNMRSNVAEKVSLLTRIVQLVSASPESTTKTSLLEIPGSPLARLLDTTTVDDSATPRRIPNVAALLEEWKVAPAKRRQLYQGVVNGVLDPATKQRFCVLLVATYASDSDVDANALHYAKQAAIGAIRDPVTLFDEQRSILSYPAVQALQKKEAKLYELLVIVQQKQLVDYESYIAKTPLDSSWGLDADQCCTHMRILSLCTLASSKDVGSDDHTLPYSVIAKTLHLPNVHDTAAVESWIIRAMSSGLLQAKMDQLNQVVLVERAVLRSFEMEQWKQLQTKLHSWKNHVGSILDTYRQQQQQMQAQQS